MSWLIEKKAKGASKIKGVSIKTKIEETAESIARVTAKMSGYDSGDADEPALSGEPVFPDKSEVLKLPVWDEFRIHYMALPGWAYRNIDTNPNMVYQQIYELARRTRIAGAKYLRTFLINGSRKPTEKYIMDAIPWNMVKQGGVKKVDFESSNTKYWDVVSIIEEACKYWNIHHLPTFWMDRYNYDVFQRDNNVQKIHGFWESVTVPIKVKFMKDYLNMQKQVRKDTKYEGSFEFINEPIHSGDHALGFKIADHHLELWRGIQNLTKIGNAMTCSRGSEFAHANFVDEDTKTFSRSFGSAEFASRDIIPEYHSVSTLKGLLVDFDHGLGSGWRHLAYNEDGADDGSYNPIPWTPFRLADPQEFYEMIKYGHTKARKRNKRFIITAFMMDCLRQDVNDNNIAKEEFDPQQIDFMNWDRPNQYRQMRVDTES